MLRGASLLLCVSACLVFAEDYQVPDPIFQVLKPRGFSVSIPDSPGVEIFAFHGNVNEPLENVDAGEISADVRTVSSDGFWTYTNRHRQLVNGDVIYYWLFVQRDGKGHELLGQTYRVPGTLQQPRQPEDAEWIGMELQ